jgi:hypothetical protein
MKWTPAVWLILTFAILPAGLAQSVGVCSSVSGSVLDPTHAEVSGATVTLVPAGGAATLHATSDAEGGYSFANVPPGKFTITAVATGFRAQSQTGACSPGNAQTLSLTLPMASVTTSVDALTEAEFSRLEVHEEEQQRLIGFIPNFYVVYDWNTPALTTKQKYQLDARTLIDPVNIGLVALTAGIEQATGEFSGFGPGPAGYFRRFGAGMGDFIIGATLSGAVFPQIFKQDPRYFYMGPERGSRKKRLGYALASSVVCRGDNRHWQPCYSNIAGELASSSISNTYYPNVNRGVGLTFANLALFLGEDSIGNVLQEFVLRHFTPKAHQNGINGALSKP